MSRCVPAVAAGDLPAHFRDAAELSRALKYPVINLSGSVFDYAGGLRRWIREWEKRDDVTWKEQKRRC
jgi:hypothetical protein